METKSAGTEKEIRIAESIHRRRGEETVRAAKSPCPSLGTANLEAAVERFVWVWQPPRSC